MKNAIFLSAALVAVSACAGTAQEASAPSGVDKPAASGAEIPPADRANTIAFKFYASEAGKPGNIFFSPYSLYSAFAMAYEGAKGPTAEEMASVFSFAPSASELRAGLAALDKGLRESAKGAEFSQANSFWAQKGYKFLPDYLKVLGDTYSAEARTADFKEEAESARKEINSWTEKRTKGRIKDLFPPDSLNSLTRLVLVNAVYFKGQWQTTFDKAMTFEADFNKSVGEKVKVKMMSAPAARSAEYAENDDLQALRLPYKSGSLAMLVLLPRREKTAADAEKYLESGRLAELRSSMTTEKVKIFFPRFTFGYGMKVNSALAALGMPTAFTDKADFSGMDGTRELYIQNAFHKAFVEVNEEGTEAAAATGVAMGLKSMPMGQKTFRADRPFLFLIEDTRTGLILFLGRMEAPDKA